MRSKPWDDIEHDRFLLVEAYSDLLFFAEMFEAERIGSVEGAPARNVYIQNFNGKRDLRTTVKVWLSEDKLARAKVIGLILDADEDAAATRRSLKNVLEEITGAQVSESGGWAKTDAGLKVGFFVVPNGADDGSGEIETLAWRAWCNDAPNAALQTCIESFLQCMETSGAKPKSPDKARVGALLSVLHDEDPRLGPGARRRVFDFENSAYGPLREFLNGFRLS